MPLARPKTNASTSNAIRNLYERVEFHNTSIKYGFIFKIVPLALVALYALVLAFQMVDPAQKFALAAFAAVLAMIIVILWQNDLLRTVFVHAT